MFDWLKRLLFGEPRPETPPPADADADDDDPGADDDVEDDVDTDEEDVDWDADDATVFAALRAMGPAAAERAILAEWDIDRIRRCVAVVPTPKLVDEVVGFLFEDAHRKYLEGIPTEVIVEASSRCDETTGNAAGHYVALLGDDAPDAVVGYALCAREIHPAALEQLAARDAAAKQAMLDAAWSSSAALAVPTEATGRLALDKRDKQVLAGLPVDVLLPAFFEHLHDKTIAVVGPRITWSDAEDGVRAALADERRPLAAALLDHLRPDSIELARVELADESDSSVRRLLETAGRVYNPVEGIAAPTKEQLADFRAGIKANSKRAEAWIAEQHAELGSTLFLLLQKRGGKIAPFWRAAIGLGDPVAAWVGVEAIPQLPEADVEPLFALLGETFDLREPLQAIPSPHGRAWLLANAPELVVPQLISDLSASKQATRKAAAETLGSIGSADALPALKEALAKEKAKGARAALEKAIAACSGGAEVWGAMDDAELDAALSALPAHLPAEVDASRLPALHWTSGTALSEAARTWLVASLPSPPDGLATVTARITDRDALFGVLLDTVDKSWVVETLGLLGSDARFLALGAELDDWYHSNRAARGSTVVRVLAEHPTPERIALLDRWARSAKSRGLRQRCSEELDAIAAREGISVDALVEAALPTLGFGADGTRTLGDYELRLDGSKIATFANGKKVSVPSDADPAVRAELAALRKEWKRLHAAQCTRLQTMMVAGDSWEPRRFVEGPCQHPLLRHLCASLVFAAGKTLFLIDDVGDVALDGPVTLPHPVQIPKLADWQARGLKQAFPQLDRPTDSDVEAAVSAAIARGGIPNGTLKGRLKKRGYGNGAVQDAGWVYESLKPYGDVTVVVEHGGVLAGGVLEGHDSALQSVRIVRNGRTLKGSKPVRCEVVADLAALFT